MDLPITAAEICLGIMDGAPERNTEAESDPRNGHIPAAHVAEGTTEGSQLMTQISALYALVLVIFGIATELSEIVTNWSNSYELFAIYMYAGSIGFFIYCYFMMRRSKKASNVHDLSHKLIQLTNFKTSNHLLEQAKQRHALRNRSATHSAPMTGSMYLRLGCILFGTVAVIYCCLMAYYCLSNWNACVPLNATSEILLAAFIFVQMYFIFENSKLAIHSNKNISRFGFMHVVATNLCLWVKVLFLELHHVFLTITESGHGSTDHGHHEAIAANGSHSGEDLATLVATLNDDDGGHSACTAGVGCALQSAVPFVATCVIEYTLICAAVTFIMWRHIGAVERASETRKRHVRVDCRASSRGLFAGLLYFSASVVSLVIFSAVHSDNAIALLLFSGVECLFYLVTTAACFAGMWSMRRLARGHAKNPLMAALDHLLLVVGLVGQLSHSIFGLVALSGSPLTAVTTGLLVSHVCSMTQVLVQCVFISHSEHLAVKNADQEQKKPGRELITFLIVANLALFLISSFQTQQHSLQSRLKHLYGMNALGIVLHSAVPLTIFFRFHSTVCLADIWKHSYQLQD